jgi:hypothetical protein
LRSGQITKLRPEPNEGESSFRFHWLAPLIMSQHDTGTMFLGGNVVFKLTDHGTRWRVISPDLSTGDLSRMRSTGSGAETYGVVYTIAESPVTGGLLWAGTDDGKLWRTADAGEHWSDLTAKLPAPARGHWISRVEAGHADANVAYVAIDGHYDGTYAPLAYRTADAGSTWQSIAGNLPANEPMRLVREDPDNPNVLYAGTEHGLWLSLDRGRSWSPLGKLPTVAVADIQIEPRTHSVVIATQGLSIYIIDQARPFAQLTPSVLNGPIHLFPPDSALEFDPLPSFKQWTGSGQFRAPNPPGGALLTYYVKQSSADSITIAITTKNGTAVAKLKGAAMAGLNRVVWDLKPTKDVLASYGGAEGSKFVHPDTYTVTVTYGHDKSAQPLVVHAMPGIETK